MEFIFFLIHAKSPINRCCYSGKITNGGVNMQSWYIKIWIFLKSLCIFRTFIQAVLMTNSTVISISGSLLYFALQWFCLWLHFHANSSHPAQLNPVLIFRVFLTLDLVLCIIIALALRLLPIESSVFQPFSICCTNIFLQIKLFFLYIREIWSFSNFFLCLTQNVISATILNT